MPCFVASCAVVSSPRSASRATFALNSAAYRFRLPVIGSVLLKGEPSLDTCPIFRGHLRIRHLAGVDLAAGACSTRSIAAGLAALGVEYGALGSRQMMRPRPRPTWLRFWAVYLRSQGLKAKGAHRRWTTKVFLAVLRHNRIEAPWLTDGPIDGERFRSISRRCCCREPRRHRRNRQPRRGHRGKAEAPRRNRPYVGVIAPFSFVCGHTRASEAEHTKWTDFDLTPGSGTKTFHVRQLKGSIDSVHTLDRDEVSGCGS